MQTYDLPFLLLLFPAMRVPIMNPLASNTAPTASPIAAGPRNNASKDPTRRVLAQKLK